MELFGVQLSVADVGKALPAALAVLAAVLKLLPGVVTSSRSHGAGQRVPVSGVRVLSVDTSAPFDHVFPQRYCSDFQDPETVRRRTSMSRRTYVGCLTSIVLTLLTLFGYLTFADAHDFPRWSSVTAVLLAVGTCLLLVVVLVRFHLDGSRHSAAKPRHGSVTVAGEPDDVRQQVIAGLRQIGARVVRINGDQVLAYTGFQVVFRNVFMGEVIWVVVKPDGRSIKVDVTSTKADFVSLSRSARNVSRFLESWMTFPGEVV